MYCKVLLSMLRACVRLCTSFNLIALIKMKQGAFDERYLFWFLKPTNFACYIYRDKLCLSF